MRHKDDITDEEIKELYERAQRHAVNIPALLVILAILIGGVVEQLF